MLSRRHALRSRLSLMCALEAMPSRPCYQGHSLTAMLSGPCSLTVMLSGPLPSYFMPSGPFPHSDALRPILSVMPSGPFSHSHYLTAMLSWACYHGHAGSPIGFALPCWENRLGNLPLPA